MNKFLRDLRKVPVIRVLFPYILGILWDRFLELQFFPEIIYIIALLLLLSFFYRSVSATKYQQSGKIMSAGYFLLFLGFGISNSQNMKFTAPSVINADHALVSGVLISDIEEKEKVYRLTMETEKWLIHDSLYTESKNLVLYIPKKHLDHVMLAGERWCFGGRLMSIRNNGNPGEFDYADYMHRRNFWSTLFVDVNSMLKLAAEPHGKLKYLPGKISRKIVRRWNRTSPDLPVLKAITLGDKSLLDQETKSAFSGSGAMHLLAVSGLHVGMIWWILDLLIVFPKRKKIFRVLKVLIILSILWIYAGITGFSDSVTRSVSMFSLVSVARSISRNSNIFNTLFLSAFILLVLKPLRLFEPGFQLSYLAVFGIVIIHPILSRPLRIENRFLKRITDLVFVSIAAQLSTLPLSLLFFNLFPVYFIFTNLFAIPLVSLLLGLFVLFSPFFLIDFHSEFFSMILLRLTHLLNQGISIISQLPGAVVENIPMSSFAAAFLIVTVFSLAAFAVYKRIIWLFVSVTSLTLILLFSSVIRLDHGSRDEFSVYNFNDCSVISSSSRGKLNSYLFYRDKKPSGFVYEYLSSLETIYLGSTEFHLFEIHVDHEDSISYDGLFQIRAGAWVLERDNKQILLCGACAKDECKLILENIPWDIVIFRSGVPFFRDGDIEYMQAPLFIADGTMNPYELEHLKKLYPGLYCTSDKGAYLY